MSDGDGLLYDGEHIFYCVTHGAIQRLAPVDKCVVTMSGGHRAACEFVDAMVGGRVVAIEDEPRILISRKGGAIETPYNWTTFNLPDGVYGIVRIGDADGVAAGHPC